MAAKKTEKSAENKTMTIEIPAIQLQQFQLTVVGDSPLIMNKWTEKAKRQIVGITNPKPSTGRKKQNPVRDYVGSMYWVDDTGKLVEDPEVNDYETDEEGAHEYERIQEIVAHSRFAFPASAFKACAIDAGFQQGYMKNKTLGRGAFHIMEELVEINGKPEIREDMVRNSGIGRSPAIRYRGEFRDWSAVLTIQFNPAAMTASQIANLINLGGFSNGIGEWRPEHDGLFGRFHVKTSD